MNNNELLEIKTHLIKLLEQNRCKWIVDQWQEEILRGKFSAKSFKELKKYASDDVLNQIAVVQKGYSAKENLVYSEPYSPQEEVDLLIESIEKGLINTFDIAEATIKSLPDGADIQFNDEFDAQNKVKIDLRHLSSFTISRGKLSSLLHELKREIYAN